MVATVTATTITIAIAIRMIEEMTTTYLKISKTNCKRTLVFLALFFNGVEGAEGVTFTTTASEGVYGGGGSAGY